VFIILSPAKSLNFEAKIPTIETTIPKFLNESEILIDKFKKLSCQDIANLMKISPKLAELNWQRFQNFNPSFNSQNSKPALFLFDGDVYKSMSINNYTKTDLNFAQNHLRILSGLYGILKPLDLMQPYRLEMGTNSKEILGKNLPEFWQEKIADFLNNELPKQQDKTIINLASEEYFAAIDQSKINGKIINIFFKEKNGSTYKTIGIFAKKARGLMADFIIKNKIKKAEEIKNFTIKKYQFRAEFSDQLNWHFYRS
jgi:cytoplasmic iron level regulating protein YaaA (DUF328/UPF0246 family)